MSSPYNKLSDSNKINFKEEVFSKKFLQQRKKKVQATWQNYLTIIIQLFHERALDL